jgi:hypothetical protein
MSLKLIAAAALIAAGGATWITRGPLLVEVAQAAAPTARICKVLELNGNGEKRGFAGTEKKTRALAVADWERQAAGLGAEFASWDASSGRTIDCQRSILTVRCIARSTPCSS